MVVNYGKIAMMYAMMYIIYMMIGFNQDINVFVLMFMGLISSFLYLKSGVVNLDRSDSMLSFIWFINSGLISTLLI